MTRAVLISSMMSFLTAGCSISSGDGTSSAENSTYALVTSDSPELGDPSPLDLALSSHTGISPFEPKPGTDTTFVVDQAAGLDTGCQFKSAGPLVFSIGVDRVVGDVAALAANGLISVVARLSLPAFDVDVSQGEHDRVFFNGHVVPGEFLTGSNNIWKLNEFEIPIEWVSFPADPGPGGQVTPAQNEIHIDIDVATVGNTWCTAIDWAILEIEVVRPVVLVHGMLTDNSIWNDVWVPGLAGLGMLVDRGPSMGPLDSIEKNAEKIGAVVDQSLTRWGVDRVNLVAHSKGGLDARHYVEGRDTVEQLVQIGTPNAGSPLVDALQSGDLVLTGKNLSADLDLLAGPEGVHLTQEYMSSVYNPNHGFNPAVLYTAVAGIYDPTCPDGTKKCSLRESLMLKWAGGVGDTVVPPASVHASSQAEPLSHHSVGLDKSAVHGGLFPSAANLYRSGAVLDLASAPLRKIDITGASTSSVRAPTSASTASAPPPHVRILNIEDEIEDSAAVTHQMPIAETRPTFVTLTYPAGSLELVLITPSGRRIDPAQADMDPAIEYETGDLYGDFVAVYQLAAPEIGNWNIEVRATSVEEPSVAMRYSLGAWVENPTTRLTGSASPRPLHANDALVLTGTVLENGVPVHGQRVQARIHLPDGAQAEIALRDDGLDGDATATDGVHSGRFTETGQPGVYRVVFTSEGTTSTGISVTRTDLALVTVSASRSAFTGNIQDQGRDLDGDGFYDQLVLQVELEAEQAATYRIFGTLRDASQNEYTAHTTAHLPAGAAHLELAFDGSQIFERRGNGPYELTRLSLVEESGSLALPVHELLDAHETRAYAYDQFEHHPIWPTGQGTARGTDVNGNARFDTFTVSVEIGVALAGSYQWSGRLVDGRGTELGFASGAAAFAAGRNAITFTFDGTAIGANGINGPYFLSSLLVWGGGTSLVETGHVFETGYFAASQFEGFHSICQPESTLWDACTAECPCDHGQGDCDNDGECTAGLRCIRNVGGIYGYSDPDVDVCVAGCPAGGAGSWDFCSPECPCDHGQGDCDGDDECTAGLRCMRDVGQFYDYDDQEIDVCVAGCPQIGVGTGDFCSPECPCAAGQGDCDGSAECQPGLACVRDAGARYGFAADVDVCQ